MHNAFHHYISFGHASPAVPFLVVVLVIVAMGILVSK